jgi:ribose 5-phosphate isomerase B
MKHTIYFASDHAGFALKNTLIPFVQDELGYVVVDCGAYAYNEDDDFTDFVSQAAREVSASPEDSYAIVIGGSGQGEAMIANRFHDVRATVYYGGDAEIIKLSKVHNNANVLSLGARFVDVSLAKKMVTLWLTTVYNPEEKYDRRNEEIDTLTTSKAPEASSAQTWGSAPQPRVVPSLPAQSFQEIQKLTTALQGSATEIQIDIVDGFFVPFVSWPFTELDVARELLALKDIARSFALEIDCMCMHPQQYLDTFVALGVQRVIIHVGTTKNYETCIAHARTHGYKIGFGILNTTDRSILATYGEKIDFVQVMGIERIGIQGQAFDPRTLETISFVTETYPHLEVAVDGAVNKDTILELQKAGATRFAPGSAIAQAANPHEAYKQLQGMIGL